MPRWRQGYLNYHACGGNGKCSTCRVLIKEGIENLTPYTEKEKLLRERLRIPENVRLACQTFVIGSPVLLHRIIRDETDIKLYIKEDPKSVLQNIGEERDLVLFFLDIRNFTLFMEAYLAFDVIHVIRRLFTMFRKSIEENHGRIIETAGDGFYAVFGLETNVREAADRALEASKLIVQELNTLNEEYLQKYFFTFFEVGIGIHSGKVIMGKVRIADKYTESIMGMPVNIAARLQAMTRELNNNIIISEELAKCSTASITTPLTHAKLKGIDNDIPIYLIGNPFANANV